MDTNQGQKLNLLTKARIINKEESMKFCSSFPNFGHPFLMSKHRFTELSTMKSYGVSAEKKHVHSLISDLEPMTPWFKLIW